MLAAGGTTNHIHLLLTQLKTITLSNYMMKIKANSSRWIKEQGPRIGHSPGKMDMGHFPSVPPKWKPLHNT